MELKAFQLYLEQYKVGFFVCLFSLHFLHEVYIHVIMCLSYLLLRLLLTWMK